MRRRYPIRAADHRVLARTDRQILLYDLPIDGGQASPTCDRVIERVKDGIESMDAEILIGWRGDLFHIVSNFGIVRPRGRYHAIGSGAQYALGALHVMDGETWVPSSKVSLAVESAVAFSPFVRGRVNGLRLKAEEAA